jgi:hypothetical protein
MGYSSPSDEAGPKAKAAALKAVALDNALAESHYALASVMTWHDWDIPKADAEWKRAVELNPNYPDGLAAYSHFLMIMGRPEEAMRQIERALKLDPFNVTIQSFYGVDLVFAHRYDEAIVQGRKTLAMQPDNPIALFGLYHANAAKGMLRDNLAILKDYLKASYQVPDIGAVMDRGLVEAGFQGAMRRAADALAALSKKALVWPTDIAGVYVLAGDNGRALEWLERAYEGRDPNLPYLRLPMYDLLRSEPRFQALFRRLKLEGSEKK